jgi:uncharacterized membrane protein
MMWWNDNGSWGHDWWWPGILVMAVFMILCMLMMARMMGHGMSRTRSGDARPDTPDAPERILANRLSSGEIDVEEYHKLRDALQSTTTGQEPAHGAGHVH